MIGTLDVLVVGAGFAGMYALHRLRGAGFSVHVVEAAPEIGGTWYHNRYPGCRCDVESLEYAFTFREDLRRGWRWSERYAAQPEILAYARWVADRLDLRRGISLSTRIASAVWDEDARRWHVTAEDGRSWRPRWLILGTGCLSVPRMPDVPGLETFAGPVHHTAAWPEGGVDFAGLTVGVIGTGSSAVQAVPEIARQAAHLTHFQRTPAYSVPARNRPLTDAEQDAFHDDFAELDAWARRTRGGVMAGPAEASVLEVPPGEVERRLRERWEAGGAFPFLATFNDVQTDARANHIVAEFVRARIRETVRHPATAEALCPPGMIAIRRICVDTGYYESFNRANVTLVSVACDPVASFTPGGLRLASGREHAFDALVLATGYDAVTGAALAIDIRGRDGLTLREAWAGGAASYLGLMVAGFPNLFTITGPGSPSVLTNLIRSIEQHVDWIADCLTALRDAGRTTIEAEKEAQESWVAHVAETAGRTLFPRTASWYMGADIPGKPSVFMAYAGGMPAYRAECDRVAEAGYEGFRLGPAGSRRREEARA